MQEKNNLILIDGDFILWKTVPNKVLSEKDKESGLKSEKTLQETLDLVDWYINEKIIKPTKATQYLAFIGGRGNFRKKLIQTYKANRTREFPKYFNLVKQYLIEEWGFIESNGFEAEDYVSFVAKNSINPTIIREDHDLDQIEGVHYNPTREEFATINKDDAEYNLWLRMLTGCTTDKVPGLPGIGPKKAEKYIKSIPVDVSYQNWILDAYFSQFGQAEGVYQYSMNYRQLYLLTYSEDFIREVSGEFPVIPTPIDVKSLTIEPETKKVEF